MFRLVRPLLCAFRSALRSRRDLALENLALRHQLSVLHASSQRRLALSDLDRAFWVALRRRWTDWKQALVIIQPETVVRWHREGFRLYWRRKSRRRPGRPETGPEIRSLIRRMATANPLWGAPRIHGELLDHVIVLGESHLRRLITDYVDYYQLSRTHLSLGKDAPDPRAVQPSTMGEVVELPKVGRLHHRYERRAA